MKLSNLLVDITQLIVEFKMRVLEEGLRVSYPNGRIFVTTAAVNSKIPQLISLYFAQ